MVKDIDAVDALPYIDPLNQGPLKNEVERLIKQEMSQFKPEDYLNDMPAVPEVTLKKLDPLDLSRYKVPPPPVNMQKNTTAWKESISNAETQVEHQNLRLLNLELMNSYSANAWIKYVQHLQAMKKQLQTKLNDCKKETEEINRGRKEAQVCIFFFIRNRNNFIHLFILKG